MKRNRPGRTLVRGPRFRHGAAPRVLIISRDTKLGERIRAEMRRLLRDPWFAAYPSIAAYRDSKEANIIHEIVIYCSRGDDLPEAVKDMAGKILFICREAKLIVYSDACEDPIDGRIAALVEQPNESALAEAINALLRPKAA